MSRGKSRSMSGSAVSSSLRNRPNNSLLAIGSTWLRPVRWQTIDETLEPRPRPGGSSERGFVAPSRPRARAPRRRPRARARAGRDAGEEAGEAELVDDAQLLLQARLGLLVVGAAARVALVEARRADLGERAARGRVLGSGVAVAEVAAEVEGQRLGEPRGLRDRLGMVGEARRHRLRGAEHVGVVAAPQRLGGVERRVLADRDEHVLQARALGRVRVDVAGRDGRDAEPSRQARQTAVERPVVAGERALQLDAEGVVAEGRKQPAHRRPPLTPLRAQPLRQTRPVMMRHDVVERDGGLRAVALRTVPRVGVGARQQPAEAAPALSRRARAA